MSEEYIVDVDHLTIRFNMASEKVDNLKEYVIKLIKHELMFQEFLALKDVNLKVKRGEAWGLIGTNGSGKSTLLKACCGILKPYKGSVTTRGTIAPVSYTHLFVFKEFWERICIICWITAFNRRLCCNIGCGFAGSTVTVAGNVENNQRVRR